jgi:hypothetical protein
LRPAAGIAVTAFLASLCVVSGAEKLKPADLVARHLDALGSAEARTALTSYRFTGKVEAMIRMAGTAVGSGTNRPGGSALLVSDAKRSRVGMEFGFPEYPSERVAFDGDNVTVTALPRAGRTHFGVFMLSYGGVVSEGLLGGVLSDAWILRDGGWRGAKLDYGGLKKLGGREVHELRVRPKGGIGGLQITCSFEADTFRHVRTVYRESIAAPMVTDPTRSSRNQDRFVQLTEDFSEFRAEQGLVLPHVYRLSLRIETNDSIENQWTITLTDFAFNKPVDPKDFDANLP